MDIPLKVSQIIQTGFAVMIPHEIGDITDVL